jgi:hypothetical protein
MRTETHKRETGINRRKKGKKKNEEKKHLHDCPFTQGGGKNNSPHGPRVPRNLFSFFFFPAPSSKELDWFPALHSEPEEKKNVIEKNRTSFNSTSRYFLWLEQKYLTPFFLCAESEFSERERSLTGVGCK